MSVAKRTNIRRTEAQAWPTKCAVLSSRRLACAAAPAIFPTCSCAARLGSRLNTFIRDLRTRMK
eukprot:1544610-Prymnesium_polylepis.6